MSQKSPRNTLISGFATSGFLLAYALLMGLATDHEAGPRWAETQLNNLYGLEGVEVLRKVTLFPEILGCEPTDVVGVKFSAIDPYNAGQAVIGTICLGPAQEIGHIDVLGPRPRRGTPTSTNS